MIDVHSQYEVRKNKLQKITSRGEIAFKERFQVTHQLSDVTDLKDNTEDVALAGRITRIRKMGKVIFGNIADMKGAFQICFQKGTTDRFEDFKDNMDVGDYAGFCGTIFTTKTGEKTLLVRIWEILSKALRPLPEKFHGLADKEQRYRKRYLDLITSKETVERFKKRTRIIREIRNILDTNDFVEIDTPILTNKASGALAEPFVTHYSALDLNVYLRIAPETYLKRAVAGGFNRVYEFARCFRNEGLDPSHLPDFTMLEYYAAYWNYIDNMRFTEKLIKETVRKINDSLKLNYLGKQINLDQEWPVKTFRELILTDSGIDIQCVDDKNALVNEIKKRDIDLGREIDSNMIGYGTLVDLLYKKVSRSKLIQPTFLTEHPIDISPLARRNQENPHIVDRFQLVMNGWEVVNAYSELIDPIDQRERFDQQLEARNRGDGEAMEPDEDFLICMEYGMPPMSGWGMGIDRFVALLTQTEHLRDTILFPLLKPETQ